jgi:hypothetical protein
MRPEGRTTRDEKGEHGPGWSQRRKVAFRPGAFEPEEESDLETGRHHQGSLWSACWSEARRREVRPERCENPCHQRMALLRGSSYTNILPRSERKEWTGA